jgi:hypothetical protein
MLFCPHELLFCAQKLIPLVKAVNSNDQPITLHHYTPMNYNTLLLCPHELQRIVTLPHELQRIVILTILVNDFD